MDFEYDHHGIPTAASHPDERYVPAFKMATWGYETSEFHIQWMRFDEDCELHPLVQAVPHVAFRVPDLEAALAGRRVIVPPAEPLRGFRCAFVEDGGAPVELLQTSLTPAEIAARAEARSVRGR